jgi:hypothetical protein
MVCAPYMETSMTLDQMLLDLRITELDAFYDGCAMLEDSATEEEVRTYLVQCYGDVLRNTDTQEF